MSQQSAVIATSIPGAAALDLNALSQLVIQQSSYIARLESALGASLDVTDVFNDIWLADKEPTPAELCCLADRIRVFREDCKNVLGHVTLADDDVPGGCIL